MPVQTRLEDIGFADFVAVLLVETLDSIVAAHASQEERLRALRESAELTAAEFAAVAVSAAQVAAALAELFPDGEGGTTIEAGGPAPASQALEELGITLPRRSVDADGNLTKLGASAITDGVRLFLAARQLESIQEVARRGIPRVVVDAGTLRAKLTFSAESAAAGAGDVTGLPRRDTVIPLRDAVLPTWRSPIRSGVFDSIRDVRLKVATPGQDTGSTDTQVFGEVEITFHTEI